MTQQKFEPRLHSPQPDHPTWALCGKFTKGIQFTNDEDQVTCGHCMRKLGHDPRADLAGAVANMVATFEGHRAGGIMDTVQAVVNAWHTEQEYIGSRRYY